MRLFVFGIILLGFVGWIMNIVEIFHSQIWPISGEILVRVVGIFIAPLGSILGLLWFL